MGCCGWLKKVTKYSSRTLSLCVCGGLVGKLKSCICELVSFKVYQHASIHTGEAGSLAAVWSDAFCSPVQPILRTHLTGVLFNEERIVSNFLMKLLQSFQNYIYDQTLKQAPVSSTYVYSTPQYFYLRKWLSLQVLFPDMLRANSTKGRLFPDIFSPIMKCVNIFLPHSFTGLFSSFLELLPPTNTYDTQCSKLSYSVALLNALSWVVEDLGPLGVTSSQCRA